MELNHDSTADAIRLRDIVANLFAVLIFLLCWRSKTFGLALCCWVPSRIWSQSPLWAALQHDNGITLSIVCLGLASTPLEHASSDRLLVEVPLRPTVRSGFPSHTSCIQWARRSRPPSTAPALVPFAVWAT